MAKKNKFITTDEDSYEEETESYEEEIYDDDNEKRPRLLIIIGVVVFFIILLLILVSCGSKNGKSSNNYLKDISVTQGTFEPAFNKDTTDYLVNVEERDIVTVGCVMDSKKAKATGCNVRVSLGDECANHQITVKAQNGKTREYNLNICRYNKDAPTIDSVTINPETQTQGSVKVTVKATAKEGFKIAKDGYSFDGGSTWKTSNVITVKENTTLRIVVIDNKGNMSKEYVQEISNIDNSKLAVKISGSTPSGTSTESNVILTSKITDSDLSNTYSYTWYKNDKAISGADASEYTASSSGTYKLVISTSSGKKATSNKWVVKIGGGSKPSASTVKITDIKSNPSTYTTGNVTVSITATASNGLHNSAYSFDGGKTWSNQNYKTFSSNQTVKLVVRDSKGNKSSVSSYTINKIDKTKPVVSISGNGLVNSKLTTVTNPTTTVSGYKYQWYLNDSAISGAKSSSYTPTKAGNYSVKVTTGAGTSVVSAKKYVSSVNTASVTISSSTSNGSTVDGFSILTANVTNGTATAYQWYKDNVAISGAKSQTYKVTVSGTYKVEAIVGGVPLTSLNSYVIKVEEKVTQSITIDARLNSYTGSAYASGTWTNKTVYIKVTATSPNGITDVRFSHDNTGIWYAHETRAWRSKTIDGKKANATIYFDGDIDHDFTVLVVEKNGNSFKKTINIKVDKTRPYTAMVEGTCFNNIIENETSSGIEIVLDNAKEVSGFQYDALWCLEDKNSSQTVHKKDALSGYEYKCDLKRPIAPQYDYFSKTWESYNNKYLPDLSVQRNGHTYVIYGYRYYDNAGNVSKPLYVMKFIK